MLGLAGCSTVTGPSLECHPVVQGKLVGVLRYTDGHADTLRARVEVWADTVVKCAPR